MKAIIIYGPPGAGKGTQAELISRRFNFVHFDTGRYLRNLFLSSKAKTDPVLKREKKINESGTLNTPGWVLKIISEATKRIRKTGSGIVYSGSPRTYLEAFGGGKRKGLFEVLENLYGRENIHILKVKISEKTSGERNKARFVCSVCGLPRLAWGKNKECIFCGGELKKRKDDAPEVIKKRMEEFEERTFPILAEAKKRKYKIVEIDGTKLPYQVFSEIVEKLKLS